MNNDLISRQAAIAVADSSDYVGLSVEDVKKVTDEVVKGLKRLPSAQPEPNDDAEFWCKRAEFYEKMCFDLIADMSDGVKIDSIIIDKNGIKFTKKQPDR